MKNCIAADIGGTKMLIAEVREDGSIVNIIRFPTGNRSREEKVQNLIEGVRRYEKEFGWEQGKRPEHIGIGINDKVDPQKGIWIGYDETQSPVLLEERLGRELGVICEVDNDLKCTVIAENEFGKGMHCRNMIYLNIGTGLAAGMISEGRLLTGSDGWAGEVGFMNFSGQKDQRVELTASGMGLEWQYDRLIGQYPDSVLKKKKEQTISGQQVVMAARQKDALACRILDELRQNCALVISNMVCVLSPEIVILGGGLVASGELLDPIREAVLPKAKQHLERGIVLTGLNPAYAGLMGAAALGLGLRDKYID